MATSSGRFWGLTLALLALVALAIRVNNAFFYPLHFGFDAPANWEYIERLLTSWKLPAPDAGWSTAHPPFFYYLSASLGRAMGGSGVQAITVAVRLLSSIVGMAGVACAVAWVWRIDRENGPRIVMAAALLLFMPAHIYMSAMLGEEILSGALISAVLYGVAVDLTREPEQRFSLLATAGLGVLAGLAFLTKLTGLLVVAAAGFAYLVDALRRRDLSHVIPKVLVFALVAGVIGGWPYVLNRVEYGYFYPQNLMVHELMFTMPPGERGLMDYLTFPLATFFEPNVLAPDLLHSVWGTTYTTLWFDGHRVILPRIDLYVSNFGSWLLVLGLLPTLAFIVGCGRGLRRAVHEPGGPDTLFLTIIALTVAGYVLFTWQNPWYATLKASYMVGIAVPFAAYSTEVLCSWMRSARLAQVAVAIPLIVLLSGSALVFTVNLVFEKREGPGFFWPKVDPSRHYELATKAAAEAQDRKQAAQESE